MTEFTPYASLAGGLLIGLAAAALMAAFGRIAGISGILNGLVSNPESMDRGWRAAFVLGLLASPIVYLLVTGSFPVVTVTSSPLILIIGGVLVGAGVTLASGCTSGHGVCGMARLSKRSFAAVISFMLAGFVTVFVTRHVLGV